MRKNVLLIFVLMLVGALFFVSCNLVPFRKGIELRGMDQAFPVQRMSVDEGAQHGDFYFVRALIAVVDENDPKAPSTQGVKIKWFYDDNVDDSIPGGNFYTTFALGKIRWVVEPEQGVPTFRVEWTRSQMKDVSLNADRPIFKIGSAFNPNSILEDHPEYIELVVITLNEADNALVEKYIFGE
jgi:hypothetical protein